MQAIFTNTRHREVSPHRDWRYHTRESTEILDRHHLQYRALHALNLNLHCCAFHLPRDIGRSVQLAKGTLSEALLHSPSSLDYLATFQHLLTEGNIGLLSKAP